jgi:hypothetical protein
MKLIFNLEVLVGLGRFLPPVLLCIAESLRPLYYRCLLLNDPQFIGLARDIYNQALVNPLDAGKAATEQDLKNKPAYIDPKQFAFALIDTVQSIPGDFGQLGSDIDAIRDLQVKKLLRGMHARAQGNLENLHAAVASWFDTSMERVSGAYKRQSQLMCFLIAFMIAGLFNIDSFHLLQSLWQHQTLAAQVAMPAGPHSADAWTALQSLPVDWQHFAPTVDAGLAVVIVGWLVRASSSLFGAPFWFNLLQQLIQLRGTGKKPESDRKA